MNRTAMCLGMLLVCASGCRMGGDTGVVDAVQEAALLAFNVENGMTTREQILLRWGAPAAEFESSRLVVHRLFVGSTGELLPISCATDDRASVGRRLYDLVVVFEKDVVSRHTLVRVR